MPFDFVKTQCQKDKSIKKSSFRIMEYYIKDHGIKSLYVGWQFRYLQYLIQSLFTVKTLDFLENKAKQFR